MRACPSTVTVALMRLAFQTIAFTLILKKWPRSWTQGERHSRMGFSLPLPFSVSVSVSVSIPVSVPVPVVPVPIAVSENRVGRKGRPRWSRSSG